MSGLSFIVTMDSGALNKKIGNLIERLANPKEAFRKVGLFLRSKILDHFDRQQGHTGKWKPLSPATIKSRKKSGKGAKALVNEGNLINSLQGGGNSIFEIENTSVKVGTTIPYAKYHQHPRFPDAPTNSLNANKKVPKRDFIYVSTKEKEQLKEIIKRYLGGTLS